MIWGGADEINNVNNVLTQCNALESPWNHPLHPWSMENLSSMKPVPGPKKVGDCCFKELLHLSHLPPRPFWMLSCPTAEPSWTQPSPGLAPVCPRWRQGQAPTNLTAAGQLACCVAPARVLTSLWPRLPSAGQSEWQHLFRKCHTRTEWVIHWG